MHVLCKFKENQFKNVSSLVISCFVFLYHLFFTVFSPFYTCIYKIRETCYALFSPPRNTLLNLYFMKGCLEAFLVLLYLERLNSLRWLSSICHLINSYASSLILAFFSSVLLWKGNQNKTLGTVWGIHCPLLSFLCFLEAAVF